MSEPTPGSDDAVKQGCTCPVLDNGRGRGAHEIDGVWMFWCAQDCPLHREREAAPYAD